MNKNINLLTKPPRRTPIIVSQKIKFILKNKIFCELGCAEGDNLALVNEYAKRVIGIDINVDRIHFAKERNLNVEICDYRIESIPRADIYYFWPSNSLRDTPYLIWRLISKMHHNRVIIFGCDNAVKNDRIISYIYSIFSKRLTFRYNEGSGFRENGFFSINIIYTSDIFFFNYIIIFILSLTLRLTAYLNHRINF